jgi:flagellar hook-basal body complex protein FliE
MNDIALTPTLGHSAGLPAVARTNSKSAGFNFADLLQSSLDRVGQLQAEANLAAEDLTLGRQTDLHSTLIAVEKAGIAMELALQIRNKLLNAYETLMRQQI